MASFLHGSVSRARRFAIAIAIVVASLARGSRADTLIVGPSTNEAPLTEGLRARFGFSFNGGAMLSPTSWGGGGFAVRGGVQAGRYVGAYVQVMPLVFGKVGEAEGDVYKGLLGTVPISALAAVTPIDHLEIALGPSVDYLGAQVSVVDTTVAGTGWYFGVASRIAFHFTDRDPISGARSGLAIGLDPHVTLVDGEPAFFLSGGFGADWY